MGEVSLSDFMKDAGELAHRAISQDKEENFEIAIYYYRESISLLDRVKTEIMRHQPSRDLSNANADETGSTSGQRDKLLTIAETKINEYQKRVNELDRVIAEKKAQAETSKQLKSNEQLLFERAKFLVNQALDFEEDDVENDEETVNLYTEAVSLCLQAKGSSHIDEALASQLAKLALQALNRAEELKGLSKMNLKSPSLTSGRSVSPKPFAITPTSVPSYVPPPSDTAGRTNDEHLRYSNVASSAHAGDLNMKVAGQAAYTDEEKRVLTFTSKINNIDYLPFMIIDLREKFATQLPYSDKDGLLKLSPKQRKNFVRWARPDEMWPNPKMLEKIDCFSIKQTVISDCSFVASLAVSALYEKKFKKRLITSIIYPQTKSGEPVYNPCGKYMIKLLLNGVPRKIILDDLLPVGKHGELLCSYSNNKGELWVSLLEKAYMKVMGGYDFPGSNSNIDLHALTGWIPERVAIHSKDPPFDKDQMFRKLHDRLGKGDVLITVATGELSEREAERAGLVPTHAYAVLDIREVRGIRLLLLKNPWSHLRWKGNYSELDSMHWTEDMKRALNYDPSSASMFDNGVFWIDYDSICRFFDVFYMNWNPALFTHTYCIHKTWSAGCGPIKDVYNIGENPQYKLEIHAKAAAAVWILLTRHITELEDFKENREYITILVYDTDGKRVFYPYEPAPMIDGVRINSPHYLCKIIVPAAGVKRYTLVVSQYSKTQTIHYTLRAYASCPFLMQEIKDKCKYQKKITGEWKGVTAGGCLNNVDTYQNNPCYQIALKSSSNDNSLIIELRGPKQYHVGFDIMCSNVGDPKAPGFFNKKTSGSFRPGFVVLEVENVPSGIYNVIPSTFNKGDEGPFFLTLKCSCDFNMKQL